MEFSEKLKSSFGVNISQGSLLEANQLGLYFNTSTDHSAGNSPSHQAGGNSQNHSNQQGGDGYGYQNGPPSGQNGNSNFNQNLNLGLSSAKSMFNSLKENVKQQQQNLFDDSQAARTHHLVRLTSRVYVCHYPSDGPKLDQIRTELNNNFGSNYRIYNVSSKRYRLDRFYSRCIDCSWGPVNVETDA